jgi:DNA-directed RNA polymerase specialized sigma24 family protein
MDEAVLQLVRKLLETHARALELFARAWCDTPEDVVQESLVRLAAEQPLPAQPLAWLYQAVRRRAITAGRAAARRRRHEAASAKPSEWFEPALDETIDGRSATQALSELPF